MWVRTICGECTKGNFTADRELWVCDICGHRIANSDLVDVDDTTTRDGFLEILDNSL